MADHQVLVNMYMQQIEELERIDTQLGGETQSGRKVLRDLTDRNNAAVHEVRTLIGTFVSDDSPVGIVKMAVLLKEGAQILQPYINKFIEENTVKAAGDVLTEAEMAALRAERESLRSAAVGLYSALQFMVSNADELPSVPRKKSAGGKKGKRIKGVWSYVVNGEFVGVKKPTEVAALAGCKAGEISAALESKGLDPSELPDTWSVYVNNIAIDAEAYVDDEDDDDE